MLQVGWLIVERVRLRVLFPATETHAHQNYIPQPFAEVPAVDNEGSEGDPAVVVVCVVHLQEGLDRRSNGVWGNYPQSPSTP